MDEITLRLQLLEAQQRVLQEAMEQLLSLLVAPNARLRDAYVLGMRVRMVDRMQRLAQAPPALEIEAATSLLLAVLAEAAGVPPQT